MAYSPVPTVVSGDLWTASDHNTYIRDNFLAGVPAILTATGDMVYASAPNTAARLANPTAGYFWMITSDGTKPYWRLFTAGGHTELTLPSPPYATSSADWQRIAYLYYNNIGARGLWQFTALLDIRCQNVNDEISVVFRAASGTTNISPVAKYKKWNSGDTVDHQLVVYAQLYDMASGGSAAYEIDFCNTGSGGGNVYVDSGYITLNRIYMS